jgi:hypothetical protein
MEPTILRVRDCRCPDSPHPDGDTVTFPPRLGLNAGLAVALALQEAETEDEGKVLLGRALFFWGPDGWNLTDEKGKPRDFDRKLLEAEFPWEDGGLEIAERADGLYSGTALAPLVRRRLALLKSGRTKSSSSPSRTRKTGTRKPSASSSAEPPASTVSTI